jgi:hypothetical protein
VGALLEEGREGVFWPNGDEAALVEPDAFEHELEHLVFRLGV